MEQEELKVDYHRKYVENDTSLRDEINHLKNEEVTKMKEKILKMQSDIMGQIDEKLTEIVGEVMNAVEQSEFSHNSSDQLLYDKVKYRNRKNPPNSGTLPEKQFLARESILTDLFKIKHFHTIYNIFIVILIILFMHTAIYDLTADGKLSLGFSLIFWNFGKFPNVFCIWLGMMASTLTVYWCFYYWANKRISFVPHSVALKIWDYFWLVAIISYQVIFTVIPVTIVLQSSLPPVSSMIVLTEQVRMIMKSHAFVRSNVPRAISYKPHSDDEAKTYPDFGHYIYFLFVPTLLYRDTYPRTSEINWKKVSWYFVEVIGVIFYISFLFERFMIPVFRDFGVKPMSPENLVVSIFGSMMPATMTLLCGFFCLLHSWLNAFAEITRFADRMFYKDWWNANSYAAYYRMWNVVVHDWLYTYVYKDLFELLRPAGRSAPTLVVFLLSALVHEYVLVFMFGFFYPMLFLAFGVFSFGLFFVTHDKLRGGNVFMWLCLSTGCGILASLYCMEWYARINCPRLHNSSLDFFVPRSWFCNAVKPLR